MISYYILIVAEGFREVHTVGLNSDLFFSSVRHQTNIKETSLPNYLAIANDVEKIDLCLSRCVKESMYNHLIFTERLSYETFCTGFVSSLFLMAYQPL